MNIQPTSGEKRLRVGQGYLDQAQIAEKILDLWLHDLGKSPGLNSPRNAACLVFDVGTGKTPTALRILFNIKEALKQAGDERWKLPSLIVCRDKARWQWMKEIQDWVPEWSAKEALMLEGDKDNVQLWMDVWTLVGNPAVAILNYNKLTDYNDLLLKKGPFLALIMDEVHAIAYASTQRNQAADALPCYYRIGLTGTAVRREPDSMHGILNWLQPGKYKSNWIGAEAPVPDDGCRYHQEQTGFLTYYQSQSCEKCPLYVRQDNAHGVCAWSTNELVGKEAHEHFYHLYGPVWGSYGDFRQKYCQIGCKCGALLQEDGTWEGGKRRCRHRYKNVVGAKNERELNHRLFEVTHLFWRLDARSIPGFPEVFPRRVDCPLTRRQSDLYRQAERGLIRYLNKKGEWGAKSTINVLAQIAWLRSIATLPPAIVLEKLQGARRPEWLEDVNIPPDMDGGKQEWVEEYFEDYFEVGDKLVVFSEWTFTTFDLYRRFTDLLKKRGEYAIHIHGKVKGQAFEDAKYNFNHDPKCSIAVCSPSGSESLNLHEGLIGTDGRMHAVHFDCAWTPAEIKQRTGRVQRYGGKNAISNFATAILDDGGQTIDSRMIDRVMARASVSDMITGSGLGELFDFSNKADVMSLLGR